MSLLADLTIVTPVWACLVPWWITATICATVAWCAWLRHWRWLIEQNRDRKE